MHLAVLLSGDHPTLPPAELEALVAAAAPGTRVEVRGLVGIVHADSPALRTALTRMAQAQEWGTWWATASDDAAGHEALADAVKAHAAGTGSAAVAFQRRGTSKSQHHEVVVRKLGAALGAAGHPIRLKEPESTVYAWFVDGQVTVGQRLGTADGGPYRHRHVENRAHFHPISLHPRRAASLLHLARARPESRIYDPFCGTGGVLLEAALEGFDVWGSDLDGWMVQGCHQTLTDVPPEPVEAHVFEADIGDTARLMGSASVDAIVTDMPYGKSSTTGGEVLASLYRRAFVAFAVLLRPGGRAVVGMSDPGLLVEASKAGFTLVEHHEERVHNSLVRHFVVIMRARDVAPS